jgi:hypothetical protein
MNKSAGPNFLTRKQIADTAVNAVLSAVATGLHGNDALEALARSVVRALLAADQQVTLGLARPVRTHRL